MTAEVLPLFPDLEPASAASTDDDLIERALAILERRHRRGNRLPGPAAMKAYLRLWTGDYEREVFAVIWLDNRHRVISCEELFQGTLDRVASHPREVVRAAIQHNAAAAILAHNHPSGVAEPSPADLRATRKVCEALGLVGVRVLDHIIVGCEGAVSFAERGLLPQGEGKDR